VFRKKGIEVLLMTDRVDEWALSFLHEFDGTPLQSVAKGAVDLGKLQDEEEKKAAEQAAETFKPVLDRLRESLKDKAKDVRVTTRLVDSPACLVVEDGEYSPSWPACSSRPARRRPRSSRFWKSMPSTPWCASWREVLTSTTWPTFCSTRPCWPKAVCLKIRPATCGG
jgi:molecular chaperone HtpG